MVVVPVEKIEEVLVASRKKEEYEIDRQSSMKKYKEMRLSKEDNLPNLAPKWVLDMISKL